jgi:hypothetical protein
VLRRIFLPKTDETIGCWRKLHNEELHNLNCSPNIIKMIKSRRMGRATYIKHMAIKRNADRILLGKPERKSPAGRSERRWDFNIKMYVREIGWGSIYWINLAQDKDQ